MSKQTLKEQADYFTRKFQAIDNLYEEYAKSVGLTLVSFNVLEIIYETPEDCTQKMICEQAHLPKQTVNTIIRAFLDQGYVELKELDSDRRNKRIWLNEEGKKYAEKIIGKMWDAEQYVMENLTDEQRKTMIEVIGIYEKQLSKFIQSDGQTD